MKILHYFLGFPPYRTGGLTKYATDLMYEQANDKHDVYALWPGKINFIFKSPKIRQHKSVNNIYNFELVNPLPIPLDEGIQDVNAYTKICDIKIYKKFLSKIKPDVIHIHTLMGLHKEFVEAAITLKIKTVFTTHDYFGICPKVTLYRYGKACDDDQNCINCIQCNVHALSLKKIQIMQSPIYRLLKDTVIIKLLRKKHRTTFFEEDILPETPNTNMNELANNYKKLREYYLNILQGINLIHFNSSLTEKIYKRYFIPKHSKVLSITHKDIADNRSFNHWEYTDLLKITYLASAKPAKGFMVLRNVLDNLWEEGNHMFELSIYSPVNNPAPYMRVHKNGFNHSELKSILSKTDVLVAPSVWYETFGFTVLEALSYGVPVIVSDHMGAKDIISSGGIVVEARNKEQLKLAILSLTKEKQNALRKNIAENVAIKTWRTLVNETYQLYNKTI